MSSSQRQQVMIRDLVEEAKKRIVILAICVVGLSYLMSLTSSSVWVNLPAAAALIISLRYFSLDYEMRRKAAGYNCKPPSVNVSQSKPVELSESSNKSDWRRKVNSPVVEDAVDHFTRHIVSEWVTDLWYSKITPDKDVPEELVQIMNGLIGEFSTRVKNVNLIDLLTRDLVLLICTHLEFFRACQAKIGQPKFDLLPFEQRDQELKLVLAAENKLHPALFSTEAEHKVLQYVMEGLMSFTLKSEDLHCSFFRYISRELLACAVMRPVLNLANPRFINERIECLVLSRANKVVNTSQQASQSKRNESPRISTEQLSKLLDPTVTGVELVQLKTDQSRNREVTLEADSSQDPLLSIAPQSSRSWISPPSDSRITNRESIEQHRSGGEWGEVLDMISRRKTAALTSENFENLWAKGRNTKKKEDENRPIEQVPQKYSANNVVTLNHARKLPKPAEKVSKSDTSGPQNVKSMSRNHPTIEDSHDKDKSSSGDSVLASCYKDDGDDLVSTEEDELSVSSSYTSEEEDTSDVTGLDSPVTKVWDGKTNRSVVISHIHHPLEHHRPKRTRRRSDRNNGLLRAHSSWKSTRSSNRKLHVWQEIERTSFLSGDGQDILSLKEHAKSDTSSEDSDLESSRRIYSGNTASSSAHNAPIPENYNLSNKSRRNSLMGSFFRLRCEVLGANIVKSDSKTFAVYSISVTDANNHSWSIKRRFRHFEELHRRLKEYPEYSLHLPPKHFLSTGLDVPIIQERCRLLDLYLKKLMQVPIVSGSIEVWDFLSVDSQTYIFSSPFSIIETLSVDLDDKPSKKGRKAADYTKPLVDPVSIKGTQQVSEHKESMMQAKSNFLNGAVRMETTHMYHTPRENLSKDRQLRENSGTDLGSQKGKDVEVQASSELEEQTVELHHDTATELTLPSEWVPPNLTAPILDLVDVVFQLQDGGWIRRKAFWVAKQILQLGMGDALDDWLLEKIQILRRGSVVASGIKRLEHILWPDGIFITKHPKRRPPSAVNSVQQPPDISSPKSSSEPRQQPMVISSPRLTPDQQKEAERRAMFVYELMIENAPAAVVSLVGRKEYKQCAKDLYFFLQSSVCLKQLAYDLLELLLLSAFPEMDYIFKKLHEEKHVFGKLKS